MTNHNNNNSIRQLSLPPGIYVIVNPYQHSHGVVAKLGGAVQRPGNINAAHSGLRPFYNAMLNEDINNVGTEHTVYLAVFWFGPAHEYNAVLVGPFGNAPQCEEQMMIVKNMMEHVRVLHEWTQIVLFGGE